MAGCPINALDIDWYLCPCETSRAEAAKADDEGTPKDSRTRRRAQARERDEKRTGGPSRSGDFGCLFGRRAAPRHARLSRRRRPRAVRERSLNGPRPADARRSKAE